MVAGGWLVVGPPVSLTWESGTGPIGRPLFGSTRQMLELVGYFYGVGALIVALSAFAVGRFASRPHLPAEEAALDGAPGAPGARRADEPAAPANGAAAGASTSTGPVEGAAPPAGDEPARRGRVPFLSRRRQARERRAPERTGTS